MAQEWSVQLHEECVTHAYDIGIPVEYLQKVEGELVLSYDLDGHVYIHFQTPNWSSPIYVMPEWFCLAY